MVGFAERGQIIKRTFLQLPPHISISISYNVFIIDQPTEAQKYQFVVEISNEKISETIEILGTSNQCGDSTKYEALQTFGPTKFIDHTDSSMVEIRIGADSQIPMKWGLRDIRLVFITCDN